MTKPLVGLHRSELPTPLLVLDYGALRRNIDTMAAHAREHAAVRPHAKVHKSAVIARLPEDNQCFAGGASWRGCWVMRISVISAPLTEADIDRLAEAIISAWRAVQARTPLKESQA